LQATRNPRRVLETLVRIGERAIISFPNFGYWRVRLSLMREDACRSRRCSTTNGRLTEHSSLHDP